MVSFLGSWFNANNRPGWEIGADASLEIPRFVAPFGLSQNGFPKEMSPRTLFSAGTSIQKNIGLDRQIFTLFTDYKWQYNRYKNHSAWRFSTPNTFRIKMLTSILMRIQLGIHQPYHGGSGLYRRRSRLSTFPNDETRAQKKP